MVRPYDPRSHEKDSNPIFLEILRTYANGAVEDIGDLEIREALRSYKTSHKQEEGKIVPLDALLANEDYFRLLLQSTYLSGELQSLRDLYEILLANGRYTFIAELANKLGISSTQVHQHLKQGLKKNLKLNMGKQDMLMKGQKKTQGSL